MTNLIVRELGVADYTETWEQMKAFTLNRSEQTPDELWQLEHPKVFTQGQAGKPEHLLHPGDIPIVQTDRGGQVTYHGPGQLVMYLLVDLKRRGLGVRDMVTGIERAVISLLKDVGLTATCNPKAPGVYIDGAKICALGLRVKRGCTYHGLSFNIDMDLEPFSRINPCGYTNLKVVQLKDFGVPTDISQIAPKLIRYLKAELGLNDG